MSIIWWEKTVEYYFVKKYVELDSFVAPLDGDKERAGDTILGKEDRWILIEFKKNESCINDECRKFSDFKQAKHSLINTSNHHLIIYGQSAGKDIELVCQGYFSEKPIHIDDALSRGTDIDSFFNYVREFVSFKNNSGGESSSGFGFVAGISKDGKVTKCMRLDEFGHTFKLEKRLQQKLEISRNPSRSGPSMDR